jgi:uncharacterized protein
VPFPPFVNRFAELASLHRVLDQDGAALIRVYGRRRLGKTEMLSQVVEQRGGLYLLVDEAEPPLILDGLNRQVRQQGVPQQDPLRSWDDLWALVGAIAPRVVVVDEFQRLFERSPEAVTRLQDHWDRNLKRGRAKLVLCGSSVGMMQRITRGRSGPLFGRLTLDLRLRAFGYGAVRLLYPDLPERDRVVRYATFGGTPHYHQFSVGVPLDQALRSALLDPGAPLRDEPQVLLRYELRESRRYHSILSALGTGTREHAQLAQRTETKPTSLGPYLRFLAEEFDLVRHDDPVLGRKRRGRYALKDPFFAFYYRFIHPDLPRLALGQEEDVLRGILAQVEHHASRVFEEVARECFRMLHGTTNEGVPIAFDALGAWWGRTGEEVDLVARGQGVAYVGEAKWSNTPPGPEVVQDLLRKAGSIEALEGRRIVPVVFSREPVGDRLREAARLAGGFALDLEGMARVFDERYAPVRSPRP